MELCEKLKQIRKENNLTQQQLADELCLSRTVITKYERGYKVPNLDTLILISNYFNTSIFDEYKNKLKLFILSIRCCIPYLISLSLLVISSLSLASNIINVNSQYGYNIYNDELKVNECENIVIMKYNYLNNDSEQSLFFTKHCSLNSKIKKENNVMIDKKLILNKTIYYLIFIEYGKDKNIEGAYFSNISISHKPFIYPLKDYDESLPYDKQTGECSKILNYYIDLIEKVK